MKDLQIEGSYISLTEKEIKNSIEQLEIDFKFNLPESYKEFVSKHNGGYTKFSIYENNNGQTFDISSFYSIRDNFDFTSEGVMSSRYVIETHQVLADNIPKHLYPFGNSPGDHDLCISTAKEDYGHIYIYALDGRTPAKTFVSDSFENFINGLQDSDIYDEV